MRDFLTIVKQAALDRLVSKGLNQEQALKAYDKCMDKLAGIAVGKGTISDAMHGIGFAGAKSVLVKRPKSEGSFNTGTSSEARNPMSAAPTDASKLAMAIKFALTGPGGATAPSGATGASAPTGATAPTAPATSGTAPSGNTVGNVGSAFPNAMPAQPAVKSTGKQDAVSQGPTPGLHGLTYTPPQTPQLNQKAAHLITEYQYDLCKSAAIMVMAKHGIPPTMAMVMFNTQLDKYAKELTKETLNDNNKGSTV